MTFIARLLYWLCWCLFRPFLLWVRYKTAPADVQQHLALDLSRPICFVLPVRSWTDLFVLQSLCKRLKLPVPYRSGRDLPAPGRPAVLYQPALQENRPQTRALEQLMGDAVTTLDYDVQLVPVSVFWGRDPGSETSLFKLLFADSVQAGRVRKLFIVLANGRSVLLNFGNPLSFKQFMRGEQDPKRAMRKLSRLFNLHFLRARSATLGPSLLQRTTMIRSLLGAQPVRLAIEAEARERGITLDQAQARARKIADEITADYSSSWLKLLDLILTPVWHRIFAGIEVRGLERVREIAQGHEMLYLPSHRSHLDYLLVSYTLYHSGLAPPHIAAGVNLNFWPVGGLLRRGGAFYMRRSFSGEKLYSTIFRTYVDALIKRGYSISFYPEGTRSRSGRLLQPKTGLMAMVVESALRQRARKVMIVPVYLGYDKLAEANSYAKELGGGGKKKESAQGLLKATKILNKSFGRAYINFGEPIRLADFADQQLPDWRQSFGSDVEPQRPAGYAQAVNRLAKETMRRINDAAVAYPVALTSVAILAAPQRAVAEQDLARQIGYLVNWLQRHPYSSEVILPGAEPREILNWAAPIARLSRIPHTWGDLLWADGKIAPQLTYYRNNVQHLFALPSLVANLFRARFQVSEDTIVAGARALYPFLRTEFFLHWKREELEAEVRSVIATMLDLGLLIRADDGFLQRPEVNSAAFSSLAMLGRVLSETLERYCMTTLLLAADRRLGSIPRAGFEEDCRLLAERAAVLTGRMAPEFFDKSLFRGYVSTLIELGVVREDEDQVLHVDARIDGIAERALDLLGGDAQQTILQLLSSRRAPAAANPV